MPAFTTIEITKILLIAALIYLAYADFRTFQLPNIVTLPIIATGLLFNGLNTHTQMGFASLQSSLAGALMGYACLWLLNRIYFHIKKQYGVGMGDAKLLSGLGAWLGVNALPNILFMASIGGFFGGLVWLRCQKQSIRSAFPFGPFLAFAGIIELLWPQLLQTIFLGS
jgi:leader peptidase (prepilin peptidase)/N-methyltransferase